MTLRQRLTAPDILIAPGVYDGLTAALATDAGFEALYLSGAAVAYTRLGRPDIGLSTASEMTDTMALIADRTDLPVIMAGKIAAMADARRHDTLIIARTDAIAVEGFDAAIDRAGSYIDAGADVLFIEAPRDSGELSRIADTFKGRVPLLANMVEGGATPISSATTLEDMGFDIVIFPGGIVRALAKSAQDYYASLKATGSNKAFSDRMHDFDGLNAAIGTPEMLALGKRFDGKS